ncbi:hypothetical protein [Verrucosispora sp. WMMD573]|uniref:hypothetical protein n=1 Tax=Verrucosispora sp. WMMD573 TaxID=3015149 RepID=UPI00248CC778|nr:hypothetical protein [Verrucosispora sp. WMMD573]WBB54650.1 hypothetical protein O7601_00430 [Verrucosispora sp. WMMD573]
MEQFPISGLLADTPFAVPAWRLVERPALRLKTESMRAGSGAAADTDQVEQLAETVPTERHG